MNQFESFNNPKQEKKFGSSADKVLERLKGMGELARKYRLLLTLIPAFIALGSKAQEKIQIPIFFDDGVEAEMAKEGIKFDTISGAFHFKGSINNTLSFDKDDMTNLTDSVVVSENIKSISGHEMSKLVFKVFNEHSIQKIYIVNGAIQLPMEEEKKVEKTNQGKSQQEVNKNTKVKEIQGERVNDFKTKKKNLIHVRN